MQCIFRKENVGKALKYRLYRHLTRFEKIIKILMSFYTKINQIYTAVFISHTIKIVWDTKEVINFKGGITMANISMLDLQNLRHLIGGFDTTHCKMQAYADQATDPALKKFFQQSAQSAMDSKQKLMQFLK